MKTYTTADGDKWDSIAYRVLGSCRYTDRLMLANTAHVRTYIFPAGVVLRLPEIPAQSAHPLPPWKKVKDRG